MARRAIPPDEIVSVYVIESLALDDDGHPIESSARALYVGWTSRPRKRQREHFGTACDRLHPLLRGHIVAARRGGRWVRFRVVEECRAGVALHRELVWMARYLDAGHLLANRGPWNLKDPLYTTQKEQP